MLDRSPQQIVETLKQLSFENPRRARELVIQVLQSDDAILSMVLGQASEPGNGRLRQLIANAVTTHDMRQRLESCFARWLDEETDEFARRAIEHAGRLAQDHSTKPVTQHLFKPQLVEMYGYVNGRVRHELRNALLGPKGKLLRLRSAVDTISDESQRMDVMSLVKQLEDEFSRVGKLCAFDPDPNFFEIRPLTLCDWLKDMNTQYAKQFEPVDSSVTGDTELIRVQIRGSDHLLSVIFWNLWLNAHQAVDGRCRITIELSARTGHLHVIVVDNGDGLPEQIHSSALKDAVSTNSPHRGRGLLEVQHAAEELHGRAYVVQREGGDYRIAISFPIVS